MTKDEIKNDITYYKLQQARIESRLGTSSMIQYNARMRQLGKIRSELSKLFKSLKGVNNEQ